MRFALAMKTLVQTGFPLPTQKNHTHACSRLSQFHIVLLFQTVKKMNK